MEVSLLVGSDLNPGSEIESDALNFAKLPGLLDDSSLPSLLVTYTVELIPGVQLPILHSVGVSGWNRACIEIGAWWYLAEALSLLLRVCLFVACLPERLRPGVFDIWGHSRQLFHCCAAIGTTFHVVELAIAYNHRQTHPQCSSI